MICGSPVYHIEYTYVLGLSYFLTRRIDVYELLLFAQLLSDSLLLQYTAETSGELETALYVQPFWYVRHLIHPIAGGGKGAARNMVMNGFVATAFSSGMMVVNVMLEP